MSVMVQMRIWREEIVKNGDKSLWRGSGLAERSFDDENIKKLEKERLYAMECTWGGMAYRKPSGRMTWRPERWWNGQREREKSGP